MSWQIRPADLLAMEPRQALVDRFVATTVVPLKDILASKDPFGAVQPQLRAGDEMTLLRFTDASRQRLAERATVVVVQSLAGGHVDFGVVSEIEQMQEPTILQVSRAGQTLRIARFRAPDEPTPRQTDREGACHRRLRARLDLADGRPWLRPEPHLR